MKNSFKYIKNVSSEEGTILLYSQIGDSIDENGNITHGINGTSFAYEMQYLQDNCKKINVRINSVGGSVLDGYSIISAMLNSKVPCDTYIDGLAASISGVIAMCGKKVKMADYGTMMLHNPSGVSDSGILALVKDTLTTVLSNRTKCSVDEMNTMMDAETWLNANQCLGMGLVDEIISSEKKIKMPKVENLFDMALIYNKLINPKNNKMENLIRISIILQYCV
jgi:ATP-dependent protease ClpP protease subunit